MTGARPSAKNPLPMVSDTQRTERIRRRKRATNGKANKKARARAGTPKFPIHPEAKPAQK